MALVDIVHGVSLLGRRPCLCIRRYRGLNLHVSSRTVKDSRRMFHVEPVDGSACVFLVIPVDGSACIFLVEPVEGPAACFSYRSPT